MPKNNIRTSAKIASKASKILKSNSTKTNKAIDCQRSLTAAEYIKKN